MRGDSDHRVTPRLRRGADSKRFAALMNLDGKNIRYLLDPSSAPTATTSTGTPSRARSQPARTGPLMDYLALYHNELVNDATQPGLPSTSCERVLMVWIVWLLTSRGGSR